MGLLKKKKSYHTFLHFLNEDGFSKLHLEEDKMSQDEGNDLTKKQQCISIQGFAIRI